MPGTVVAVHAEGRRGRARGTLLVMESMKMELQITAARATAPSRRSWSPPAIRSAARRGAGLDRRLTRPRERPDEPRCSRAPRERSSAEFAAQRRRPEALVARAARAARASGAPAAARRRSGARERHVARGKLLPRERVDRLLRPRHAPSSSSRRSPPRASTTTTPRAPGSSPASAGSSGRHVVIVANDATVKGGTYYPMTVKKHLRAQEIALAQPPALHLPGRLRRRLPADAGRGLPRPRPLRPHLLQPGDDVGAGRSRRSRR